jgi:hypothetical protein
VILLADTKPTTLTKLLYKGSEGTLYVLFLGFVSTNVLRNEETRLLLSLSVKINLPVSSIYLHVHSHPILPAAIAQCQRKSACFKYLFACTFPSHFACPLSSRQLITTNHSFQVTQRKMLTSGGAA